MGTGEKVAKVDKLAVALVLAVDDAPPVLSTTDGATVDVDGLLTANDGKGDQRLQIMVSCPNNKRDFGLDKVP